MSKDIDLFGTKYMTVREISDALDVNLSTVQKKAKLIFPDCVKNGKTTRLNEEQVTIVKRAIFDQNPNLGRVSEVKTDLEKELIIQQAMQFQMEKIATLSAQVEIMKPKAELAEMAIRDETTQYSITDAGKHLGIRQSEMFSILREKNLLTVKNLPTQRAKDYNILSIRSNLIGDKLRPQAVMTMENIYNFKERYCK